jgi:hypothetical protein
MRLPAPRAGRPWPGAGRGGSQGGREGQGGLPGQQVGPPGKGPADDPRRDAGLPADTLATIGAAIGAVIRAAIAMARRHKLEATAVVLLGLGGLIFPPVWLIGAAVALASKVWDFRDRWIGLAGPVFLVIVGMVADVSLSASRGTLFGYVKEAWIFGGHLSRIAALLGAGYLAWRAQHGRRPPPVPPWNKPHRIG